MILADRIQKVEDVQAHYDDLDWVYRDIWGLHVHHGYWRTGKEAPVAAVEALIELVASYLDLRPGQKISDIGCGYGATANYLAMRHNLNIIGFTVSAAQARFAIGLEPSPGAISCHQQDWLQNKLPDAYFDRAYAIESTEHMSDKRAFFSEAARTLRSGGRLVVCAWLADVGASRASVRHLLEPICREGRLPGMGTREEYEEMAGATGFSLLAYKDLSRNVRRTWSICGRRLLWKLLADGRYRKLVTDPAFKNKIFLLSIPRLMIALRIGAMRYGLFTWQRTDDT